MSGGYLGVDAFFVLSGYLITSLLLLEWDRTAGIDFRAFWSHRARRLLPALFLVLLGVAAFAALTFEGSELDRLRAEGLAALFYGINWFYVVAGSGNPADFGGLSPLDHMWSLAIEEQFYLVWPLIVFATLKISRGRHRALVAVAITISLVSAVVMATSWQPGDIQRAYKGTDARAHQLLIGALLAIALLNPGFRRFSDRIAPWAGVPAAAACGIAILFAPSLEESGFLYRGGAPAFAVAVAVVIAAGVAPRRSAVKTLLEMTPLVWLGRISYGIYLWHVPVQVALSPSRTGLGNPTLAAVRVAVTVAIAALSFYLVEQPIRRGTPGAPLTRYATPVAVTGVATALIIATVPA